MIIAKINAGLCNQIYFFATAYALSREWREELIIDPDVDGNAEWTYLLDEFNLPPYKKEMYPLRYHIGSDYVKLTPALREKVIVIDESYFEEDGEYLTIPKEKFRSEYPGKDIYLKGSFLKRQMFTKYLADIREMFTLKEPSPFVEEFEKRIKDVTAVGVHIRRQGFAVLGDHNGMDFFMAAIVYMRRRYTNTRFYIFSDELDFVKEHLGTANDIFYIDAMNGYRGDIEEFICLTKCHHYILTRRSTYGRMAEILNPSEEKVSVLFGGNTWNDSEERFHFMSQEEVQELSPQFKKRMIVPKANEAVLLGKSGTGFLQALLDISLDSGPVTALERRQLLYLRARLYEAGKKYGQAVHLCRLLEEQYGEDSEDFHEFFADLLVKNGSYREALTEYIRISQRDVSGKSIFDNAEYSPYKKLLKSKGWKHYIIVPYGTYDSQYLSEMQMLGLILGRMGNRVSFVFKRSKLLISEKAQNAQMIEWNYKSDQRWMDQILERGFLNGRYCYGYPCYDYASVLEQKKSQIQEIADRYPDSETIIVGRDPEFISEDVPFRKIFVDYSEPFDEAYLRDDVGPAAIQQMYEYADMLVTGDNKYSSPNRQVIYINDRLIEGQQRAIVEIPCWKPTVYTEDYLEIALKIAFYTY